MANINSYACYCEMLSTYNEQQALIVERAVIWAALVEGVIRTDGILSSEVTFRYERRTIRWVLRLHQMLIMLSSAIMTGRLRASERDHRRLYELYDEVIFSQEDQLRDAIILAIAEPEIGIEYNADTDDDIDSDGDSIDSDDESIIVDEGNNEYIGTEGLEGFYLKPWHFGHDQFCSNLLPRSLP